MRRSYLVTGEQQILRALTAVLIWMVALLVVILLATFLTGSSFWGFYSGTTAWLVLFAETLPLFVVSVPEVCALMTVNLFLRPTEFDRYANNHVYVTGISFKFPWEQVKEGLYINLRFFTQRFEELIPAKDGVQLDMRGALLYRPSIHLLPRFIAVDGSTINAGLQDIATGTLSRLVGKRKAASARNAFAAFQKALIETFESPEKVITSSSEEAKNLLLQGLQVTLETLFGIDFVAVPLADVDYSADYQKALNDRARATLIEEAIAALKDGRQIKDKDAVNAILIQFGLVKKDVFELEGSAHEALAALLAAWAGVQKST